MLDRAHFAKKLGDLSLSHVDRAVAFLWFYRQTQDFEERTASELGSDLHEEGFPRPNVTLFHKSLTKSKYTIRGKRAKTFQLDVRHLSELDKTFGQLMKLKNRIVSDAVFPNSVVSGTRPYLEKIVRQINGAYDAGWYDACAVLCRRLMESLIVEAYIANRLKSNIEHNGQFFMLDRLITAISAEKQFTLGRNSGKTMELVKQLGDTAAHDRTYITQQQDIDDIKVKYRPMINDLLVLAKIK